MNEYFLQLWLHVLGDYVTQSHWMAINKTSRFSVACLHAAVYTLPFILAFHPSYTAVMTIYGTHALIDRYRLARYVVFAKNVMLSPWFSGDYEWSDFTINDVEAGTVHTIKGCSATGYLADTPPFLAVWLLIVVDNWLHISINALALRYL